MSNFEMTISIIKEIVWVGYLLIVHLFLFALCQDVSKIKDRLK